MDRLSRTDLDMVGKPPTWMMGERPLSEEHAAGSTTGAPSEQIQGFLLQYAEPLRRSLQDAISSLPAAPKNAGELSKLLDIDSSQVWRLWEATYADDLRTTALRICGESGLERFLSRMTRNGLDAAHTQQLRNAHSAFEQAVKDEIGDQATFRLMLTDVAQSIDADPRLLRAQFDAARWRFGVQAEAVLAMCIRLPSQFDGLIDTSMIFHCEKLRSLRPIQSYPLDWIASSDTRPVEAQNRDGDHALKHLHVAAIPFAGSKVCSNEPPAHGRALNLIPGVGELNGRSIWCYQYADSVLANMFSGGKLGKAGESTFCYGHTMIANITRFTAAECFAYTARLAIPCEESVMECFITDEDYQNGLVFRPQVHDLFYKRLESRQMSHESDFVDRPFGHRLEHYPPGRGRPMHKSIPRYETILQATENHLGISLESLHLFRWRIKLPPVGMYYVMMAGAVA